MVLHRCGIANLYSNETCNRLEARMPACLDLITNAYVTGLVEDKLPAVGTCGLLSQTRPWDEHDISMDDVAEHVLFYLIYEALANMRAHSVKRIYMTGGPTTAAGRVNGRKIS